MALTGAVRKAFVLMFAVLATALLAGPAGARETRVATDRRAGATVWSSGQTVTGIQRANPA